MIAVALITQDNQCSSTQWQFDKVMSAIAFDLDLSVVFMHEGKNQLNNNKAWKSLHLYGIEKVFYLSCDAEICKDSLIRAREITHSQLKKLINQADIII